MCQTSSCGPLVRSGLHTEGIEKLVAGLNNARAFIRDWNQALQHVDPAIDVIEARTIDKIEAAVSLRHNLDCSAGRAAETDRVFINQIAVKTVDHAIARRIK